jgi:hypothetical protein
MYCIVWVARILLKWKILNPARSIFKPTFSYLSQSHSLDVVIIIVKQMQHIQIAPGATSLAHWPQIKNIAETWIWIQNYNFRKIMASI